MSLSDYQRQLLFVYVEVIWSGVCLKHRFNYQNLSTEKSTFYVA